MVQLSPDFSTVKNNRHDGCTGSLERIFIFFGDKGMLPIFLDYTVHSKFLKVDEEVSRCRNSHRRSTLGGKYISIHLYVDFP